MLEELEKAHIYIEQLNEQLNQTAAEKAAEIAELKGDNEELTARLDRIEALVKATR